MQENLFHQNININGLSYIQNYISESDQARLMRHIDSCPWNMDLKRRTQHYGYRYDYKIRSTSTYLGEIPKWLNELAERFLHDSIFEVYPDQVIVNEYQPGQGIAQHIDCIPCFKDTICSLSLLSGCTINFAQDSMKYSLYLEPRSLLILKDEARYKWTHGIPARKKDHDIKRGRRVSLTFRQIIK